ncbi:MAG: tetratricopeptide repeat protein [Myxococcota bacterium]
MTRFALRSVVCALALAMLVPLSASADDRDDREDRRALSASQYETMSLSEEYRALARQKRHESMDFLKDILANRAPKGQQKAEMMLRLADLYFEEGRDIYLTEMAGYQEGYDACFNDETCNVENYPEADNTESRSWQERSIKLYKAILQNYPSYARADEATFYLASALSDLGRKEEAVNEFTRLVRTYPKSGYVPDAYVLIGEYYFDNNNAYKALLAYQKAVRFKDSDKYSFALYKLAWCYYNVGEYGKAIDSMKAVIATSMTATEGQDNSARVTLQEEALNDLVRFFADAGEMEEAYAYFNKLGKRELISKMLKRLANMYFEQGKFEECIATYRRLIAEDPQSPRAPDYQNEIIMAYQKTGRKTETIAEIDRMRTTYGKSSPWSRANSGDPDALQTAEDYLEKSLRTVALNYHNEAKKYSGRMANETYGMAEQAYSVYLQEFPEGKNTYEMRFAYGELLYKLKKYDTAYDQYMAVVKTDPNGKHSKFCANSAVYAAEEMSKREPGPENPKGNKEPVEMSDWESKYLTALDQYIGLYPEDKDTPGAIYKAGYLLYNHNLFADSSVRFRKVIAMQPQSRDAMTAVNLILDSLNLVEDWASLKENAKAFYDQEGLGNQKFKGEVYTIYENASLKLIEETFKQDEDKMKAASAYLAFVEEFPESKSGDLALNNAAVYFFTTDNYREALNTRLQLVEQYPESKYYKPQLASIGFAYESMADFATAADYYEKLVELDPESEQEGTKEALFSAGLYRKSLGEWEAAVTNYEQFIERYGDDERVPGLKIDIAQLREDNGVTEASMADYQAFFTKPPEGASIEQVFYARRQYGKLLEAQSPEKAGRHWKETLAAYNTAKEKGTEMGAATVFIAEIMYNQAQPIFDNYMSLDISGPKSPVNRKKEDKILKDQLLAKVTGLKAVEKEYASIIELGAGEWGLAALVTLGKAYEDMGVALRESYAPSYLTEDQEEIYRMQLEDRAYIQEEKMVNAYTLALEKAYELNLYNENTAFAVRKLGELRPDDFPLLDEQLLDPRYTSSNAKTREFLTIPE